jgi:hypothetical protein
VPWIALLFGAGCAVALIQERGRLPVLLRDALEPSRLRWIALGAWGLLAGNNLAHGSRIHGFDEPNHYEYLEFLLRNRSLPYADDGLQMFQPPLAYLLAAPLWATLSSLVGPAGATLWVRLLPLACGMAQVEIAWRAGRTVFPQRPALQRVAILVGGFLPMNLYISQAFGNEPVSGILTAGLMLGCLKSLVDRSEVSLSRTGIALGGLFGLALLAKVTAVVLLPALCLCLIWIAQRRGAFVVGAARCVSATLGSAGAIAGWYYVRNWLHFGRPFVGGWDPSRGFAWWQDPGYRIPSDFTGFGAALSEPIYAAVHGLWDGLCSTLWLDGYLSGVIMPLPWNYDFLVSMSVLSIPMTLAGLVGTASAVLGFRDPSNRPMLFCVACLATLVAAIGLLFLMVPTYSSAKATYALGLTPCIALLCASGLAPVLRYGAGRILVSGYVCAWLGIGYSAYFAR